MRLIPVNPGHEVVGSAQNPLHIVYVNFAWLAGAICLSYIPNKGPDWLRTGFQAAHFG